jgi:hypothetical protein
MLMPHPLVRIRDQHQRRSRMPYLTARIPFTPARGDFGTGLMSVESDDGRVAGGNLTLRLSQNRA